MSPTLLIRRFRSKHLYEHAFYVFGTFSAALVVFVFCAVAATPERQPSQLNDPRNAAASELFREAYKLAQEGNHKAAVEKYELGLRITPDSAPAHYYLAESFKAIGEYSVALFHYKKTAALGPNTKEGIIAQQIVQVAQENAVNELNQVMRHQWQLKDYSVGTTKCPSRIVAEFASPEPLRISFLSPHEVKGLDFLLRLISPKHSFNSTNVTLEYDAKRGIAQYFEKEFSLIDEQENKLSLKFLFRKNGSPKSVDVLYFSKDYSHDCTGFVLFGE